jgi:hypothetical protein
VHPSHTLLSAALGVDEAAILREVRCPQLFMPAGNDGESVKAGGLADTILGDRLKVP